MKLKIITAVVLMLIGSNILTYGTVKYLSEAKQVPKNTSRFPIHSWNTALGSWSFGGAVFLIGLGLVFIKEKKQLV